MTPIYGTKVEIRDVVKIPNVVWIVCLSRSLPQQMSNVPCNWKNKTSILDNQYWLLHYSGLHETISIARGKHSFKSLLKFQSTHKPLLMTKQTITIFIMMQQDSHRLLVKTIWAMLKLRLGNVYILYVHVVRKKVCWCVTGRVADVAHPLTDKGAWRGERSYPFPLTFLSIPSSFLSST